MLPERVGACICVCACACACALRVCNTRPLFVNFTILVIFCCSHALLAVTDFSGAGVGIVFRCHETTGQLMVHALNDCGAAQASGKVLLLVSLFMSRVCIFVGLSSLSLSLPLSLSLYVCVCVCVFVCVCVCAVVRVCSCVRCL